jgi:FKBP-type peptidyl-prolyl cis-trans isomerase 2
LVPALLGAPARAPALEPGSPAEPVTLDPDTLAVQVGSVVHLEYALTNAEGELLDSNRGRRPLVVTQGHGDLIPGLDRAILGMKVGEERRVAVPPEEGYGSVDPDAITEVPKERIPAQALAVGARLLGQTQSGRELPVRVREIKDATVVLDLNHPLAGQTLVVDVRILLIEP